MNQKFVFTGREKMATFIMMGIGILSIIIGLVLGYGGEHGDVFTQHRLWTNLLNNSTFFLGVSLLAFLLMCGFVTGYSGWFVAFKRVMEAMATFIPVGGVLVLIVVLAGVFGVHDIYFWTNPDLVDPTNSHYDELIHKKSGLLNSTGFIACTIIFVALWTFFARKLRAISIAEDNDDNAGS